jgi:hypothetical protein
MSKYRTIQEIERKYEGNWVCITNCEKSEYHEIIGGEVIAANKDKEPILDIWGESPGSFFGYMGELPEETGGYLL